MPGSLEKSPQRQAQVSLAQASLRHFEPPRLGQTVGGQTFVVQPYGQGGGSVLRPLPAAPGMPATLPSPPAPANPMSAQTLQCSAVEGAFPPRHRRKAQPSENPPQQAIHHSSCPMNSGRHGSDRAIRRLIIHGVLEASPGGGGILQFTRAIASSGARPGPVPWGPLIRPAKGRCQRRHRKRHRRDLHPMGPDAPQAGAQIFSGIHRFSPETAQAIDSLYKRIEHHPRRANTSRRKRRFSKKQAPLRVNADSNRSAI